MADKQDEKKLQMLEKVIEETLYHIEGNPSNSETPHIMVFAKEDAKGAIYETYISSYKPIQCFEMLEALIEVLLKKIPLSFAKDEQKAGLVLHTLVERVLNSVYQDINSHEMEDIGKSEENVEFIDTINKFRGPR